MSKTAAICIQGGLGNQLFGYAIARYLEIKRGYSIVFELSHYKKSWARPYMLEKLGLGRPALNFSMKLSKFPYAMFRPEKLFRNFPPLKECLFVERGFEFDPKVLTPNSKNVYLWGYWQSYKYFEEIENHIRNDLNFALLEDERNQLPLKDIDSTNSISVHVRRGDYLQNKTNQYHGLCSMEYYQSAIAYFKSKIVRPKFYLFSDDTEWVKKEFAGDDFIAIDINTEYNAHFDLLLMSRCRHNIIANSSFSWWGAWLNVNRAKTVIAPKKWFQNPQHNTSDLLPSSWLRF